MANHKEFKKERIPSFTYIKEYDNFEDGYNNMISVVPDIKMYAGENNNYDDVINSLLNTISESIPSPINPNFPNTMSFSINSKEVGFLTDDQLAFGWKIFLQKNNDSMAFQFRITFLSLSISKRKYIDVLLENGWKEKDLSDKQSRFWNEIHTNSRPSYKDAPTNKQSSNKQPEKRKVVQEVHVDNNEPIISQTSIADTSSQTENITQFIQKQVVAAMQKMNMNNSPVENKPHITEVNGINTATKSTLVNYSDTTKQQPVTNPKQVVKISDETQTEYLQPSRDISQCAIYPYEGKATFRINHFGNEFIYNINDRQDGIFLDRNSENIKIDNVLYNYKTFKVTQLPAEYEADNSTYIPGTDKMREHGPVDDSVFIPQSIIEKANNPDLSYSETVIANKKKQEREARMNGFNPPPQQFNSVRIPNTVKGKPALVIDKPIQNTEMQVPGVATQSVRVTDNR